MEYSYGTKTYSNYLLWSITNFVLTILIGAFLGFPFALPAFICSLVYTENVTKKQSTIILVLNIFATVLTVIGIITWIVLVSLWASGAFKTTVYYYY